MKHFLALILCGTIPFLVTPLDEEDRVREFYARGYSWPFEKLVPDTPGWRNIFERRFEQLRRIEDSNERYNGWVQSVSAAMVAPNFTESGWGLTRAPTELVEELVHKLHTELPNAHEEKEVNVIEGSGSSRPLFIYNYALNNKALEELKPMHEEWAGVELVGEIAYGLRVYRNDSRLLMHVDKSKTHVISCILHIDHSEDSEPWPIVIEDFQGNTNEVVLESGDMLFYESSKCFHGRPQTFKGSWYSSIFIHYSPVGWDKKEKELANHYAVPPNWYDLLPDDENLEKLQIVGTSMKEPECEHVWCALKDSVKWYGPAIEGEVITTGWKPEDEEAEEL